ncbi:MAG: hypothetical protein DBX06_00045 [Candidatus Poseidoniales archaeon]|jgi:hypothetical protein|nr:hypothetical protein [Candidatus Poseidoniales archaeon]RCH73246.1 MAG: hypothetical protein DBX06_00045 [Candidatus Poseidoniales archaeon]|tara:strand:- start:371 stop:604 length:234 start_codon:yes stop_codon:yes gene_type:complete
MDMESLLNFLVIAVTVLLICLILIREIVKRWRLGLRMAAGDESLLDDGAVSMKTITDAPEGSVIVPHTPATRIEDNL